MLASFYTSVIFCLFSSLVFFFPPLLYEINLKNMWHINRISYIQRWVIGDPKSYFKHGMFTRPDISFLENGTVWNRDTVEGTRMWHWLLCSLASELGKISPDDAINIRQIFVTMGLISGFPFWWTLSDTGHSILSRYYHTSLRDFLNGDQQWMRRRK